MFQTCRGNLQLYVLNSVFSDISVNWADGESRLSSIKEVISFIFSTKNLYKALTRSTYCIYPPQAELRLGPDSKLNTRLLPLFLFSFLLPLCHFFLLNVFLKQWKRHSRRPGLSTENGKFGAWRKEGRKLGRRGRCDSGPSTWGVVVLVSATVDTDRETDRQTCS